MLKSEEVKTEETPKQAVEEKTVSVANKTTFKVGAKVTVKTNKDVEGKDIPEEVQNSLVVIQKFDSDIYAVVAENYLAKVNGSDLVIRN